MLFRLLRVMASGVAILAFGLLLGAYLATHSEELLGALDHLTPFLIVGGAVALATTLFLYFAWRVLDSFASDRLRPELTRLRAEIEQDPQSALDSQALIRRVGPLLPGILGRLGAVWSVRSSMIITVALLGQLFLLLGIIFQVRTIGLMREQTSLVGTQTARIDDQTKLLGKQTAAVEKQNLLLETQNLIAEASRLGGISDQM